MIIQLGQSDIISDFKERSSAMQRGQKAAGGEDERVRLQERQLFPERWKGRAGGYLGRGNLRLLKVEEETQAEGGRRLVLWLNCVWPCSLYQVDEK